ARSRDGGRGSRGCVRDARHHGRYPRRPAGPAARVDPVPRPGEGRAGADEARPTDRLDGAEPRADPARPAGVTGPQAAVRPVPARRPVPESRGDRPTEEEQAEEAAEESNRINHKGTKD